MPTNVPPSRSNQLNRENPFFLISLLYGPHKSNNNNNDEEEEEVDEDANKQEIISKKAIVSAEQTNLHFSDEINECT